MELHLCKWSLTQLYWFIDGILSVLKGFMILLSTDSMSLLRLAGSLDHMILFHMCWSQGKVLTDLLSQPPSGFYFNATNMSLRVFFMWKNMEVSMSIWATWSMFHLWLSVSSHIAIHHQPPEKGKINDHMGEILITFFHGSNSNQYWDFICQHFISSQFLFQLFFKG